MADPAPFRWRFPPVKTLLPFILVGFGGAVGSMVRYAVTVATQALLGVRFPYGTCFVNITGSFLIALAVTVLAERSFPNSPLWRVTLVTGFLGGYTTFSSFVWECDRLMKDGEWLLAAMNMFGSIAAGLLAFRVGSAVAKAMIS